MKTRFVLACVVQAVLMLTLLVPGDARANSTGSVSTILYGWTGSAGVDTVRYDNVTVPSIADLSASSKQADVTLAYPDRPIGYSIILRNTGTSTVASAHVTDTLPAALDYVAGTVLATSGNISYTNRVILWDGSVSAGGTVTLTFSSRVASSVPVGTSIVNSAQIQADSEIITRTSQVTVSPHTVSLPLIQRCPGGRFSGRVTYQGMNQPGIGLSLRFYNGSAWSTFATTTTDSNGQYLFTALPSLGSGQRIYVRYTNSVNPSYLSVWQTPQVASTSGCIAPADFDIAGITLASPGPGATVSLPAAFSWNTRSATPTDSYEWNLFDPTDGNPFWWTRPPVGYVNQYTLNGLPSGFVPGTTYGWFVAVNGPDGGYGESYYYRTVRFANYGSGASLLKLPFGPEGLFETERVRNRENR